jgi:hypothetical protein
MKTGLYKEVGVWEVRLTSDNGVYASKNLKNPHKKSTWTATKYTPEEITKLKSLPEKVKEIMIEALKEGLQ